MTSFSSMSIKTKMAVVIAMTLWASAFVGIREGLQGYSPGGLALLRFLIAAVVMAVFYVRLPQREKISLVDALGLMIIGAFTLGGYHVALNYGEESVTSSVASFIISQSPVITTFLAILFLGERLNRYIGIGMIVSVLGTVLIMMGQYHNFHFDIGNLFVLIAALSGSIYSVLQKPFLKKYHIIEVTAYLIWGGALGLLFYMPALFREIAHAPSHATWAAFYLGVFPTGIAYLMWSYVLANMPVSRATNFMYAMPLVATLLGWLCLHEIPRFYSLLGGLMALAGLWIVNQSYRYQLAREAAIK